MQHGNMNVKLSATLQNWVARAIWRPVFGHSCCSLDYSYKYNQLYANWQRRTIIGRVLRIPKPLIQNPCIQIICVLAAWSWWNIIGHILYKEAVILGSLTIKSTTVTILPSGYFPLQLWVLITALQRDVSGKVQRWTLAAEHTHTLFPNGFFVKLCTQTSNTQALNCARGINQHHTEATKGIPMDRSHPQTRHLFTNRLLP
jgi:hypothetical protein